MFVFFVQSWIKTTVQLCKVHIKYRLECQMWSLKQRMIAGYLCFTPQSVSNGRRGTQCLRPWQCEALKPFIAHVVINCYMDEQSAQQGVWIPQRPETDWTPLLIFTHLLYEQNAHLWDYTQSWGRERTHRRRNLQSRFHSPTMFGP